MVSTFSLYYCLKNGLQIFDIQDISDVTLKEKRVAFQPGYIRTPQEDRLSETEKNYTELQSKYVELETENEDLKVKGCRVRGPVEQQQPKQQYASIK